MEDLIYKFLIQSDYPRASIVTDITAVDHDASPADASFVIVDPQTTDCLAVIKVVGPVNANSLVDQASLLAGVANGIGGRQTQGFVVRVDAKAKRDAEQVQFYRCHPNTELQQISTRTFPDFESLKVSFKLMAENPANEKRLKELGIDVSSMHPKITGGAIIPGVSLLLLALLDWLTRKYTGAALFDVTHSILLVGGAVLLSIPALFRYVSAVLRH